MLLIACGPQWVLDDGDTSSGAEQSGVVESEVMSGGSESEENEEQETAGDEGDDDDDVDDATDGPARFSGCVVDLGGQALGQCYAAMIGPITDDGVGADRLLQTGEDGCFAWELADERGVFEVHFYPPASFPAVVSGNARQVELVPGSDLALGEVVLPDVGPLTELEPDTVADVPIDSLLAVTIDTATTDWAFNEPIVGGVRLPRHAWEFLDLPPDVEVLGVWAFAPFGIRHPDTFPFAIADSLGLAVGDTARVFSIEHWLDYGAIREVATISVTSEGIVSGSHGLPELTWMVVGR